MVTIKNSGFSKYAYAVDKFFMKVPYSVPETIIDIVSKIGSAAFTFIDSERSVGAEERIRGVLSASVYHASGLRLGRGIIIHGTKNVALGSNVRIGNNTFISAAGSKGQVKIGNHTHIDVNCVLYGQGGLFIGNACAIASGVIIYTQTNQYIPKSQKKIIEQGTRYASVRIGNDVWIGAGAIIMPGITVEDHAVIGAGAVLIKDVKAWKVVAGVPAREINDRRGEAQ